MRPAAVAAALAVASQNLQRLARSRVPEPCGIVQGRGRHKFAIGAKDRLDAEFMTAEWEGDVPMPACQIRADLNERSRQHALIIRAEDRAVHLIVVPLEHVQKRSRFRIPNACRVVPRGGEDSCFPSELYDASTTYFS